MNELGIHGGWLTVNRFCNFRCLWCYATGTTFKPEDNMPFGLAKKLIDLMHKIGIRDVILIGGETLFWPHIFKTASYLKSLGMTSTVVTNGWLLGFEKFRRKVEESDITVLNISLKAGNRQQHINLTGFDGFERVIEGIRETSKWAHIDVGVSTVISIETLGNIEELAQVTFGNGASSLSYSVCGPIVEAGRFDSRYMPEPIEVIAAVREKYYAINELSQGNFSIEGVLPVCLWPPEFLQTLENRDQISYGCHFKTRSGLLLDRWGKVIPCNHLFDYPLGQYGVDFVDLETFTTFWRAPQLEEFYDKMLEYPASACISCSAFDKCGGGCPLNWFVREPESIIPAGGLL